MIIGGGNCAIDGARTLLRLGVSHIRILYRREKEQMPANPQEVEAALEEGIRIDFLTGVLKIRGDQGRVTGVECIKNYLGEPDDQGRKRPFPIEGSEFILACDAVIPAIGQEPELDPVIRPAIQEKTLDVSAYKRLRVDPRTLSTNIPGFFAGGDVVTGPATVVEAVAAGRRAAVSIHCFLRGSPYQGYWYPRPRLMVEPVELTEADQEIQRPPAPKIAINDRITGFKEVELPLNKSAALREAKRCLRCDL